MPRWARRVACWALMLVLVAVLRIAVVHPQRVRGDSMAPTVRNGDVVLAVNPGLVGAVDGLRRGDLVTLPDPQGGGPIVKRVVGLAGDEVSIEDAVLLIGGRPVPEPYVDAASIDGLYYGPITVPPEQVLVMGDNRALSVDSRAFGPVPVESLTGRVLVRLWPWRR